MTYNSSGQRRTALSLKSSRAEAGDLFKLFLTQQPPLSGPLTFQAESTLLSGAEPLLHRLKVTGTFEVDNVQFANRETQRKLSQLSKRMQKGKAGDRRFTGSVPMEMDGAVTVQDTQAQFSRLQILGPGLMAGVTGSLSLDNRAVDLRGQMRMEGSLSRALGGVKGFFAIPLNPFFRKDGKTEIAFRISGPIADPSFKTSLRKPRTKE